MAPFPSPLSDSVAPPPKALSATTRPDGWVDVVYSLPGLRRAVVAVPEHAGRFGGHPDLGRALHELTTEVALIPPPRGRSVPLTGQ